ncbi:MAG: hypothetical protein ABEK59_01795 [Halobacteria archaeon]
MTEDEVRLWMVERTFSRDIRNVVRLTYATEDGERYLVKEKAVSNPQDADSIPCSIEAEESRLSEVPDVDMRERYEREAGRLMEEKSPDESI